METRLRATLPHIGATMRTFLVFLFLMASACANDLPKDPNIDQDADADADEGAPGDADADADVGSTGDEDADSDVDGGPVEDVDADADADVDADGGPEDDLDGDGYPADVDCDDADFDVFPGADEVCDGVDNDCDGDVDDEDDNVVGDKTIFYADRDGDGFGDPEVVVEACTLPDGYVEDASDCDDTNTLIGGPTAWYTDADSDGFGGPVFESACIQPAGTYPTSDDCDDTDPEVNPTAEDLCGDGVDSDCGGEGDWTSCTDVEPDEVVGTITCSDDAGPFTVSGDHIQINYGAHGMWWDDESALAGLEIDPPGSGAWADVTYPGTHLDQLFVTRGASSYTIGSPSGSTIDNLTLLCSTPVEVGDVIGAVHRYYVDGPLVPLFVLTKSELWNRADKSMLVHFRVDHSILSAGSTFSLQRITDPDQDSPGTSAVYFENPPGDPLLTAEGPESGWTVGVGRCSWRTRNGAYDGTGWGALAEPVDSCDPDGLTDDYPFTFQTNSETVPSGATLDRGYVLTVGVDFWEAFDEWTANKLGLCGDLYETGFSPIPFSDCAGRPTILDPAEAMAK